LTDIQNMHIEDSNEPSPPGRIKLDLERYFRTMVKNNASDLHLRPNRPPSMRINMVMHPVRAEPTGTEKLQEMVSQIMTPQQKIFFQDHGSIDLAVELPGSDRFRINVYRQRGQISMAIRRVTRNIPTLEELNLPAASLRDITNATQGLILLAGPTGCGKSTTISAMLEHINKTRPCHIVTIEDPIEFLFEDKKALVSQREVGIDVATFKEALKYLMREDPDVVLIGEMRDYETFQAALQASETGHLVFGTIHASSASQTVSRLLDLFSPEDREQIRQSLAFNLRAIVCQKLLPSVAEGILRIPAVEIMAATPMVRQFIHDAREIDLPEVIAAGERDGIMKSFATSLLELVEKDCIDPKVAYDAAPNADELKMRMKGISGSRGGLIGRP